MLNRVSVVVALLFLLDTEFYAAQVAPPSSFTAVPCPNAQWSYENPSFEALSDAKAFFGRYSGGTYRIEIPNDWNGELLLVAHGIQTHLGPDGSRLRAPAWPGAGRVGNRRWREHIIGRGFAWAASSYRCNGVVGGVGLLDTLALRQIVTDVSRRRPTRVYLTGGSQGGLTTWLGLRYFPGTFAGGLATCPALDGSFLKAVRGAAEFISGISFESLEPQVISRRVAEVFGEPPNYTEKGRQLASVQIHISGGPRPFAVEGLATRFLPNVVGLPSEMHQRAASNSGTTYRLDESLGLTAGTLNAKVRRVLGDRELLKQYPELRGFDGQIEQPLLTLHGTGDLQVPIIFQRDMRNAVAASGREHLLVQRVIRVPGHCGFSDDEHIQAFDDLVTWVRTGQRPDGDDVLQDFRSVGRKFTNPIRAGDPGREDLPQIGRNR